jgi:hypothetical protein
MRFYVQCRALAVIGLVGCVAGCGINGDFGRMRPSLVHEDTHAWIGPAAAGGKAGTAKKHQLTDEERRLRDLAYPLIEPPYDRNQWYSVVGEIGLLHQMEFRSKRTDYASRLMTTPYRSQTARYNKLLEDIRNDAVRLDPFFAVAHYVTDMDRKREKSMAHVSGLTPEDRFNTLQSIKENRAIVRWVRSSLEERAASYRIALEQLVIAAPLPVSVEAERALTLLHQRISGYTV